MSDSDEEDSQMEFWNNWLPPSADKLRQPKYRSCGNRVAKTRKILFNFSRVSSVVSVVENFRTEFHNWIPPSHFLNVSVREVKNPIPKTNQKQLSREKKPEKTLFVWNENNDVTREVLGISENRTKSSYCAATYRKEVNSDWGERRQLHDIKFSSGSLIWGVVHVGIFGSIKLWVNEYGNMCCLACGKISKLGSEQTTFISITKIELLRKMLLISSDQWASLCEVVKETKTVLTFDAFEDSDVTGRSSLERLWFFICKRRHFIPRLCMLLKFNGVVKCFRKFEISPKLVVEDIRNILGEPIL